MEDFMSKCLNKVVHGDCLEVMEDVDSKSIDMILCDLPYGTTSCKWDSIIDLDKLWKGYMRTIKENRAMIFTASQPFTTKLINSNFDMFRYCLVWDKKFGIPSHARIRPMKTHEDIVIFCKGKIPYNPQMIKRDKPIKSGGNKCNSLTSPLTRIEGWKKIYNLKFPISILHFPREIGRTKHPTQKPVKLFEYLIKTYTNEGDLVLDNCIGSGTTGVACKNLNRNFIGIEKELKYCKIASERIGCDIVEYIPDKPKEVKIEKEDKNSKDWKQVFNVRT